MNGVKTLKFGTDEYAIEDLLARNSLSTKVSKTLNNQTLTLNSETELYLWNGYSSIVITDVTFATAHNIEYKLDDGSWTSAYQIVTPYTIDVTDAKVIRFRAEGGASYPITLTCDLISDTEIPQPRPITDTAKGTSLTLTDSDNASIKEISIMGKSMQDGTPSIDNPIPIVDITSEEIEITDGTDTQTANLDLVLRGIPVSSGGNYTDNNNQQWLCDTIERYADGTGKLIQRVANFTFNGTEEWSSQTTEAHKIRLYTDITKVLPADSTTNLNRAIMNCLPIAENGRTYRDPNVFAIVDMTTTTSRVYLTPYENGEYLTVEQWKTYLASNNATLYACLITPIETPLTAEQLEELDLDTYYPTTNINSNADVVVEYVCDTKNYIDKKTNALQNAIISLGGNI